ncbi:MAG: hypothetical protein U0R26_11530 [Solirubrobacterales bacterium]
MRISRNPKWRGFALCEAGDLVAVRVEGGFRLGGRGSICNGCDQHRYRRVDVFLEQLRQRRATAAP